MAEGGDQYVLRLFTEDDYAEYSQWWTEGNPPGKKDLPLIGLVVGNMLAVGFLAQTDTSFGIIVYWYANPNNPPKVSHKALKVLFMGLCDFALVANKEKVFCYSNHRAIIKMLESINFINYDGHLIWGISNDK